MGVIGVVIAWLVWMRIRVIEKAYAEEYRVSVESHRDWEAWEQEVDHDGAA